MDEGLVQLHSNIAVRHPSTLNWHTWNTGTRRQVFCRFRHNRPPSVREIIPLAYDGDEAAKRPDESFVLKKAASFPSLLLEWNWYIHLYRAAAK